MTTAIAVMAKAPRPGASKTRLIPRVTPDQAAQLSAAFLSDVTTNIALASKRSAGDIAAYVAYAPAGTQGAFDGILAPGARLLLADGEMQPTAGVVGFGACLLQAVRTLFDIGHAAACVLNSDSPNLPNRILLAAHKALSVPGDRIVLGATEDGGYYLLGMKRAHATLFANIDWSTERVAAQTRARALQAGLPVVELEEWYDVDDSAALDQLIHDLAEGNSDNDFEATQTIACLRSIGMQQDVRPCGNAEMGAT